MHFEKITKEIGQIKNIELNITEIERAITLLESHEFYLQDLNFNLHANELNTIELKLLFAPLPGSKDDLQQIAQIIEEMMKSIHTGKYRLKLEPIQEEKRGPIGGKEG